MSRRQRVSSSNSQVLIAAAVWSFDRSNTRQSVAHERAKPAQTLMLDRRFSGVSHSASGFTLGGASLKVMDSNRRRVLPTHASASAYLESSESTVGDKR